MKRYFLIPFFVPLAALYAASAPQNSPFESNNNIVSVEPIDVNHPQEIVDDINANESHQAIRASDYCAFLNQVTVSDNDSFYNEKMGIDPKTACIKQQGTPGNYFYELFEGRENFPVTYLSEKNVIAFIKWLENKPLPENEDTMSLEEQSSLFLGSNLIGYQMALLLEPMNSYLATDTTVSRNIFDYTPHATAGQRALEGFGLYGGGVAGLMEGCQLGSVITATLFPSISIGASLGIIALMAIIFSPIGAYLGEKFGKWLGS